MDLALDSDGDDTPQHSYAPTVRLVVPLSSKHFDRNQFSYLELIQQETGADPELHSMLDGDGNGDGTGGTNLAAIAAKYCNPAYAAGYEGDDGVNDFIDDGEQQDPKRGMLRSFTTEFGRFFVCKGSVTAMFQELEQESQGSASGSDSDNEPVDGGTGAGKRTSSSSDKQSTAMKRKKKKVTEKTDQEGVKPKKKLKPKAKAVGVTTDKVQAKEGKSKLKSKPKEKVKLKSKESKEKQPRKKAKASAKPASTEEAANQTKRIKPTVIDLDAEPSDEISDADKATAASANNSTTNPKKTLKMKKSNPKAVGATTADGAGAGTVAGDTASLTKTKPVATAKSAKKPKDVTAGKDKPAGAEKPKKRKVKPSLVGGSKASTAAGVTDVPDGATKVKGKPASTKAKRKKSTEKGANEGDASPPTAKKAKSPTVQDDGTTIRTDTSLFDQLGPKTQSVLTTLMAAAKKNIPAESKRVPATFNKHLTEFALLVEELPEKDRKAAMSYLTETFPMTIKKSSWVPRLKRVRQTHQFKQLTPRYEAKLTQLQALAKNEMERHKESVERAKAEFEAAEDARVADFKASKDREQETADSQSQPSSQAQGAPDSAAQPDGASADAVSQSLDDSQPSDQTAQRTKSTQKTKTIRRKKFVAKVDWTLPFLELLRECFHCKTTLIRCDPKVKSQDECEHLIKEYVRNELLLLFPKGWVDVRTIRKMASPETASSGSRRASTTTKSVPSSPLVPTTSQSTRQSVSKTSAEKTTPAPKAKTKQKAKPTPQAKTPTTAKTAPIGTVENGAAAAAEGKEPIDVAAETSAPAQDQSGNDSNNAKADQESTTVVQAQEVDVEESAQAGEEKEVESVDKEGETDDDSVEGTDDSEDEEEVTSTAPSQPGLFQQLESSVPDESN
eukprot:m.254458 g.254458  ORF g.254458 m.254458 type:complete len:900 (-) comp15493_c9_seq1:6889-9588(-)